MATGFHGATFRTRKLRGTWGENGPQPVSLVRIKPDRVGMRMKLADGRHIVMPIGCSTSPTR
jgi:hypothetical protein